jgi:hypothetical protein
MSSLSSRYFKACSILQLQPWQKGMSGSKGADNVFILTDKDIEVASADYIPNFENFATVGCLIDLVIQVRKFSEAKKLDPKIFSLDILSMKPSEASEKIIQMLESCAILEELSDMIVATDKAYADACSNFDGINGRRFDRDNFIVSTARALANRGFKPSDVMASIYVDIDSNKLPRFFTSFSTRDHLVEIERAAEKRYGKYLNDKYVSVAQKLNLSLDMELTPENLGSLLEDLCKDIRLNIGKIEKVKSNSEHLIFKINLTGRKIQRVCYGSTYVEALISSLEEIERLKREDAAMEQRVNDY